MHPLAAVATIVLPSEDTDTDDHDVPVPTAPAGIFQVLPPSLETYRCPGDSMAQTTEPSLEQEMSFQFEGTTATKAFG